MKCHDTQDLMWEKKCFNDGATRNTVRYIICLQQISCLSVIEVCTKMLTDWLIFFQLIKSPQTSCAPVVCSVLVQKSSPKTSWVHSSGFTCARPTRSPPSSYRSLASSLERKETTHGSESAPWRSTQKLGPAPGRASTSSLCCRLGSASQRQTMGLI